MTYAIFFSTDARQDLTQATRYYQQLSPKLVAELLTEIKDTVEQIELFPYAYQVAFTPIRRAPLRRFPYMIYYAIQPNHSVEIYAILHQHLSLDNITEKLKTT